MISRQEQGVDIAITVGSAAMSGLLVLSVVDGPGDRAVAALVALAHVTPLAWRRRRTLPAFVTMVAAALLTLPLGVPVVVLGPAALVGIYTVGARTGSHSRMALAGALLTMGVVVLANGMDAGTVASNAIGLTIAWWLGDRSRRTTVESARQRAAAAETVRRAAADERLRIARELHDVVAHAMSVIAVQAGTGRFVIDESPEVAREALSHIESTSRAVLQEMRRLLSVLRDDTVDDADLGPAPGLRDLSSLISVTEQAGVAVRVVVEGEPVALPSGADLCAYRIVQEALTNVRTHASARSATVTVRYAPGALDLEIVDDGNGGREGGATPTGHGLIGMRERAELYGGVLQAGPGTAGGYRVHARLPLAEAL